ncbi:hypothetical protein K402DRAFT_409732 [Aulographum hederae CBS 113979]|uniref:Uncharacterized protein n=1 Tax=Aulographum hederae CBS 113979 TaxID=1176131 RepID=A0A6G1HEB2_9PEZI|nr:hypothetical protein K402DRAFT_409732 [Aulographum hederae CBS 113979]
MAPDLNLLRPVLDSLTTRLHTGDPRLIVASPYTTSPHYLDLDTLSPASRIFAQALKEIQALKADYATASYEESFNWDHVVSVVRSLASQEEGFQWEEQGFYTVIFRSKLNEGIDRDWLGKLDQESHREAMESGGLLKYWFGVPDGVRANLATCLWRSREDARKGGLGPWHKKARGAAREMYERITFDIRRFVIEDGANGWRIDEWKDE